MSLNAQTSFKKNFFWRLEQTNDGTWAHLVHEWKNVTKKQFCRLLNSFFWYRPSSSSLSSFQPRIIGPDIFSDRNTGLSAPRCTLSAAETLDRMEDMTLDESELVSHYEARFRELTRILVTNMQVPCFAAYDYSLLEISSKRGSVSTCSGKWFCFEG